MGAIDYEEGPICRITSLYAKDAEGARSLLLDRQDADENVFCNGCGKCFN